MPKPNTWAATSKHSIATFPSRCRSHEPTTCCAGPCLSVAAVAAAPYHPKAQALEQAAARIVMGEERAAGLDKLQVETSAQLAQAQVRRG